ACKLIRFRYRALVVRRDYLLRRSSRAILNRATPPECEERCEAAALGKARDLSSRLSLTTTSYAVRVHHASIPLVE
ncbi:MAG: hypothetical protein AAFZ87_21330, partial [Planctomycetota bacterium]